MWFTPNYLGRIETGTSKINLPSAFGICGAILGALVLE
jgi:hypothetical protein